MNIKHTLGASGEKKFRNLIIRGAIAKSWDKSRNKLETLLDYLEIICSALANFDD